MTFICTTCQYPSRDDACDNPGCVANPGVSEMQKAGWRLVAEKRAAEEAERERIRAIRGRMR
jgi:hypothetical protein